MLSLDVEGAELSVLATIDFKRTHFGLIVVEDLFFETGPINKAQGTNAAEVLISHGYLQMAEEAHSRWLVHPHFYRVYRDAIPAEAWNQVPMLGRIRNATTSSSAAT